MEELSRLKRENLNEIKKQLDLLGFSSRLSPAVEFYLKYPQSKFQLLQRERLADEKICFRLFYEQTNNNKTFKLSKCEATLRKAPPIPNITIQGVNAKKLDKQMLSIDWSIDHHSESLINESIKTKKGLYELEKIDSILKSINKLYGNGEDGKNAAERLMYKHWLGEPWEPNTISLDNLKAKYEWKCLANISHTVFRTKSEIYSELKSRALKDLEQSLNNNLITNKNYFMNDKNYEYLTNQLKSSGFGDTLNDELRKNMEKQNAEFTLKMQQSYGADNVSVTLHFKKSAESDMFFFNKYDLELKKEDNENALKQTFYPDKNITLKEGYNLLDGRAVHKTLTTKEDEKYAAWLQLDFKNNTQSGNYQFKQYHQNYGFDLEKSLMKYPIKELNNETYKANLIRSLERGNLQLATFQVNGKEEKIYLTPLPGLKAFSAFDSNMKKIKLSDLMQSQKQEPANKQEIKQTVSEKQSPAKESKINTDKDKPVQKKSRRQKVA